MTEKASFEIGQQVRVIEEVSAFHGETGPVSGTQAFRPTPDSPVYYLVDLPEGHVSVPFEAWELELAEGGEQCK